MVSITCRLDHHSHLHLHLPFGDLRGDGRRDARVTEKRMFLNVINHRAQDASVHVSDSQRNTDVERMSSRGWASRGKWTQISRDFIES